MRPSLSDSHEPTVVANDSTENRPKEPSASRYMVIDPWLRKNPTAEEVETILNVADEEGWDLASTLRGVFSNENGHLIERTVLVMRRRGRVVLPAHERSPFGENVANIVRESAAAFGIHESNVFSKTRGRWVTMARHVSAYVMRNVGMSYPDVGKALSMDHSSAMHACNRVENDPSLLETGKKILARFTRTTVVQQVSKP